MIPAETRTSSGQATDSLEGCIWHKLCGSPKYHDMWSTTIEKQCSVSELLSELRQLLYNKKCSPIGNTTAIIGG